MEELNGCSLAPSKTFSLVDNLRIGEEIRMITLAQEWLNNHTSLRSWINGKYVRSNSSHNSTIIHNETECQGIKINISIEEGMPHVDDSIQSCQKVKCCDPKHELYQLGLELESKKKLLAELNYFTRQENNFNLFIDCFKFYSSASIPRDFYKKYGANKIVLIVINEDTPDWLLGTSVAGALLAGCSVIINPCCMDSSLPYIPYLLAETSKEAGLPAGLINVVPSSVETTKIFLSRNFDKVVFFGDLHEKISFRSIVPHRNFSNLTLGHTAFIILNNCDLDGPARKLLSMFKNWDNAKSWKPDLIVIEESILSCFMVRLFEICFPDTNVEDIAYLRKEILKEGDLGLISGINVGKLTSAIDKRERNVPFKDMGGIQFEIIMKQDKVPLNLTSKSNVIDVSVCRTGKEAVGLLNNFPYCLGTSIWTENITEGIELALELESSSVWINCHGITDPCVSFEPSRLSGNGSFGGLEGFLNFAEVHRYSSEDESEDELYENWTDEPADKNVIFRTIETAVKGFNRWMKESDKAKYLKEVDNDEIIKKWAENTIPFDYSVNPMKHGLHAIQVKKPIGVILIVIDDWVEAEEHFSYLVTPAIAFGNAVVVVGSGYNKEELDDVVKRKFGQLPKGVLNVLEGFDSAIYAGRDPNIKAIWFSTPYEKSSHQVNEIQKTLAEEGKNFWCVDKNVDSLVFHKQCLKKQTIWLPVVHRF